METYHGHVRTPADAIVLFEACRLGSLPRVQRRLSEKERQSIKSGSVFVWDEREAGMRRWTDGKSWSASRVSGSFLTYREMEGKRGGNNYATPLTRTRRTPDSTRGSDSDVDMGGDEGQESYRYKPDGLMKQSFSITTSTGNHLHLISYYSRSSPQANQLQQPTHDPNLRHIRPPKGMYPESTVQEQSSIPAVTRAPMPGHLPVQIPATGYTSRGASHPAAAAYAEPHMYPRAWPGPPATSPPGGYPQYAHRSYGSSRPSPHMGVKSLAPPSTSSRQPSQAGSPAGTPPTHQIDVRLMAPGANSLPPVRADLRSDPSTRTPSPIPPRRDWTGTPVSRDGAASAASTIPSIGALMNGVKDPISVGSRSASGSPGNIRQDGPQDIPNDKLGFGEDMRALRVLDRAFKT